LSDGHSAIDRDAPEYRELYEHTEPTHRQILSSADVVQHDPMPTTHQQSCRENEKDSEASMSAVRFRPETCDISPHPMRNRSLASSKARDYQNPVPSCVFVGWKGRSRWRCVMTTLGIAARTSKK
jgi:hypothetical protein